MQRHDTSRFALLGLLIIRPMSGYEMRAEIAASLSHFWSESYGQIYPALKKLARKGLVKASAPEGPRHQRRYQITPAGRRELREWLRQPPAPPAPPRHELLLKLFFGFEAPPAATLEHVRGLRERAQKLLATYAAVARAVRRDNRKHPGLPYWLLTLSLGKRRVRATLEWCREAERALRSRT